MLLFTQRQPQMASSTAGQAERGQCEHARDLDARLAPELLGCLAAHLNPQNPNHEPQNNRSGPVDPSFRALSGRLEFAVRRQGFNKDSLPGHAAGGLREHARDLDARGRPRGAGRDPPQVGVRRLPTQGPCLDLHSVLTHFLSRKGKAKPNNRWNAPKQIG